MQRLQKACVAVLVLALAGGCNQGKMYGRIIGFVVNGVTGQRLNAFPNSNNLTNLGNDANATTEVYALVQGSFKRAQPCGQGDINTSNKIPADGCYRIEGVPTDTDVPIFAQFDGFEPFHGTTRIVTNAVTTTDLIDTDPQKVGNIMMWPVGFSEDYSFNVVASSSAGSNRPVANAQVNCQADPTTNSFSTGGTDFIQPEQTTLGTVQATTDANGMATIPGAQLVNGSNYHCDVFTTDEFENRTAQGTVNFTAGVTEPTLLVSLTLGGNGNIIYAVRANNDDPNALLGATASLIVTLNRPIEIIPGSEDCQKATINAPDSNGNGNTPPALPTNVANNTASETVTTSVSADGLTLTITNKPYVTPLDTGDYGAVLSFDGIHLHSKDATLQRNGNFRIGAAVGVAGSTACTYAQANGASAALFNTRTNATQDNTLHLF